MKLTICVSSILFGLLTFTASAPFAKAAQSQVRVEVYAASWCGACKFLRAAIKAETGSDLVLKLPEGVAGLPATTPVTWLNGESAAAKAKGVDRYPTIFISGPESKDRKKITGANLAAIKLAVQKILAPQSLPDTRRAKAAPLKKASSAQPKGARQAPALQYYAWFFLEDGTADCIETDAAGNAISANQDPEICFELYPEEEES